MMALFWQYLSALACMLGVLQNIMISQQPWNKTSIKLTTAFVKQRRVVDLDLKGYNTESYTVWAEDSLQFTV